MTGKTLCEVFMEEERGKFGQLDINTARGRECAADQLEAMTIVYGHSPDLRFLHTPTNEASPVDGFIARGDYVIATAEVKSRRDMDYEKLMGQRQGEWLLTMNKLRDMAHLSAVLRMPGYGFLYLPKDRMVLAIMLTNKAGNIVCEHRTERTQTQATINGGIAHRVNAFIKMHKAKKYQQS